MITKAVWVWAVCLVVLALVSPARSQPDPIGAATVHVVGDHARVMFGAQGEAKLFKPAGARELRADVPVGAPAFRLLSDGGARPACDATSAGTIVADSTGGLLVCENGAWVAVGGAASRGAWLAYTGHAADAQLVAVTATDLVPGFADYSCRVTAPDGSSEDGAASWPPTVDEPNLLVCPLPDWPEAWEPDAVTAMRLGVLRAGRPLTFDGRPGGDMLSYYQRTWSAVSPSEASLLGGTVLTITGDKLTQPPAPHLVCVFTDVSDSSHFVKSVAVAADDDYTFHCTMPPFGDDETDAILSVETARGTPVPYVSGDGEDGDAARTLRVAILCARGTNGEMCSGRGECVNNDCKCDEGYAGEACDHGVELLPLLYDVASSDQFIESRPRTPLYCAEGMFTCSGECNARYGSWEITGHSYEAGNSYVGFDFLEPVEVRKISLAQHHGNEGAWCRALSVEYSDTAGNQGPWTRAALLRISDGTLESLGQIRTTSALCPAYAYNSDVWQTEAGEVTAAGEHRAWRVNCVDTTDVYTWQFVSTTRSCCALNLHAGPRVAHALCLIAVRPRVLRLPSPAAAVADLGRARLADDRKQRTNTAVLRRVSLQHNTREPGEGGTSDAANFLRRGLFRCTGECSSRYGSWEVATDNYSPGNAYVGFDWLEPQAVRQVSLLQHHGAGHTFCKKMKIEYSDTQADSGPWHEATTLTYKGSQHWINTGAPGGHSELCPSQAYGSTVWQKNILQVPSVGAHRAWRVVCVDTESISQWQFFDLLFYAPKP